MYKALRLLPRLTKDNLLNEFQTPLNSRLLAVPEFGEVISRVVVA